MILSLLNPFGWFGGSPAKLSGGGQVGSAAVLGGNAAGRAVTPETALGLSTYWACVKIIAQTIGTLPCQLYRVKPDGSRVLAIDHPLYDLLNAQPYDGQTAVEFWEGIGACLAVWGNAYALKLKVGGRLVALELLRPVYMSVQRLAGGGVLYRYSDPLLGPPQVLAPEDLFHVRGFGFGDVVGLSPIQFNRNSLGTAIAADEAAGAVFRNGLRVSGWFRYKGAQGILKPEQREDALRSLSEPFRGPENAGKVGVLPGDFDFQNVNMNPADAELFNNRKLNVEEICRAFGVPPVLVGHIGQGQTMWGTGVEHIVLAFMTTGLRPFLHRIEAAIGRDIIGRAERGTVRAAFDVEELLRGDNKGMAEVDQSLANTGIMTRNEIRARRGLPPKPGGDTLTVQSALLPIEMLGEVAKLPKDKEVAPGADVGLGQPQQDGGGPKGQGPFDEGKAWNPNQPRDALGRFGSGSEAPAGTIGEAFLAVEKITGNHKIDVLSKKVTKYAGHDTIESYVKAHPKGRAYALRQIAADYRDGKIAFSKGGKPARKVDPEKYNIRNYSNFTGSDDASFREVERDLYKSSLVRPETDREKIAIGTYSGSAYGEINGYLRGTAKERAEMARERPDLVSTIRSLDSALKNTRVTEDVLVYRGVGGEFARKLRGKKAGAVVRDAAFLSTSLDRSVAEEGFTGGESGVVLTLLLPKGNRGYVMNGRGVSGFAHEHEMLLPRGTRYRIVSSDGPNITAEIL